MDFTRQTTHGGPVTLNCTGSSGGVDLDTKQALRRQLRAKRRAHVAALDPSTLALLFRRPPSAILAMIPKDATIGLYHPVPTEAPTGGYARFFAEAGHSIALPHFAAADSPMMFRDWRDPYADSDLVVGPFGALQPPAEASEAKPDVVFVPLVGFTESGARLGQGGGHYDRWLANHPQTAAIGMGWDVQSLDILPLEPHDRMLTAIVTPTRLFGPFERTSA